MKVKTKKDRRNRVHLRSRKRLYGTAHRPRLVVFRSLAHVYVQVIDDTAGRTIVSASSIESALKSTFEKKVHGGNIAGARAVGKVVAERLIASGVSEAVFDRGGFLYHGRVQAVAEAAREAGLRF
jgi:large subunit ribosomal protein L18